MIKVTSLVLHHHISEGCAMSWPIDPRFNIFNDPPGMEVGSKGSSNGGAPRSMHSAAWGGEGGGWGARGSPQRSPPSYAEVICSPRGSKPISAPWYGCRCFGCPYRVTVLCSRVNAEGCSARWCTQLPPARPIVFMYLPYLSPSLGSPSMIGKQKALRGRLI